MFLFIAWTYWKSEEQSRMLELFSIDFDLKDEKANILEQLPEGLIITDSDAIKYMNKESKKILMVQEVKT